VKPKESSEEDLLYALAKILDKGCDTHISMLIFHLSAEKNCVMRESFSHRKATTDLGIQDSFPRAI
jgi:hypothetical protein